MFSLDKFEGFEWDKDNQDKNWLKHRVHFRECEEIFSRLPLLVSVSAGRSAREIRFQALGKTAQDRLLFLVFTVRNNKLRVISARDMSRKERKIYASIKTI